MITICAGLRQFTAPLPTTRQGLRPPCVLGPCTHWHTQELRNHGRAALPTPMQDGLKGRVHEDGHRQLTVPRLRPQGQWRPWGCCLFRPTASRPLTSTRNRPPSTEARRTPDVLGGHRAARWWDWALKSGCPHTPLCHVATMKGSRAALGSGFLPQWASTTHTETVP